MEFADGIDGIDGIEEASLLLLEELLDPMDGNAVLFNGFAEDDDEPPLSKLGKEEVVPFIFGEGNGTGETFPVLLASSDFAEKAGELLRMRSNPDGVVDRGVSI